MSKVGSANSDALLGARLDRGDEGVLADLFARYRESFRRMVQLRLDRRLTGRVDPDDVVQDAWLAALARLGRFRSDVVPSPYLWLRTIVGQTLIDVHRRHLGAVFRSATLEVPLGVGAESRLLWASGTSPSQAAVRSEAADALISAIHVLSAADRKVILLRHFEELGNSEIAQVLGISCTAASNRYVRAVVRLREALADRREGLGW